MAITDEIVVKFLPGVSKEKPNALHEKYKTKVIKVYEIFQIIRVSKGGDALEIANNYYESGLAIFSTPNFFSIFKPFQNLPNDTYFGNQVTCHNTGQIFNDGHSGTNDADIDAPEAWEMTTGDNNIVIAVIDEGVTNNHPDLPNIRQIRLNGSDFVDGDANPSPTGNNNHGNACAGVIGATMNNNQGITGIAPDCRIMPIRIDYTSSTVSDFALAIRFAANNGAEIISNSWGIGDPYSLPPYSPNLQPSVVNAIQYAVDSNCLVVFAAGNSARHTINDNGYVAFPANVTIPGVVTVGASDRDDNQSDYSPTSDPNHAYNQIIDIVAPSHRAYPPGAYAPEPGGIAGETYEMWSIDIPNNAGYNTWHGPITPPNIGEVLPNTGTNHLAFTGRFGGTSHSCPVVASVAALVLSVDQSLTYLEVFNILTTTTDEVGGYTYSNGRCNEMGHGRVNACRAVLEAFGGIMSITGPSLVCTSNTTFTLHDRPPGTTVDWTRSSNLRYVSGQGTDNYTVKAYWYSAGWGGVQATITSTCGETIISSGGAWVGNPVSDDLDIINTYNYPDNTLCEGDQNQLIGNYTYNSGSSQPAILDYDWDYSGWSHFEVGATDNISYVTVPYSFTYKDIKLRAANLCGESEWKTERFYPNQNCGYFFSFSPNPADEYVEISIDEGKLAENEIDNYEVRIYNSLKIAVFETGKIKEPLIRINATQFQNGVYFIYFIAGEKTDVKQLVVSH